MKSAACLSCQLTLTPWALEMWFWYWMSNFQTHLMTLYVLSISYQYKITLRWILKDLPAQYQRTWLVISQCWCRYWTGVIRHKAITWTCVGQLSSLIPCNITRPQWINSLAPETCERCGINFKSLIFKLIIPNSRLVYAFTVKLLLGECHRTSLMRIQHWVS